MTTLSQQNDDATIPLDANETPEECAKRLSRRLSEYEAASVDIAGRANQLRKERDAERALNHKLRKEIEKLSNQLLRERTTSALLEKEVKMLEDKNDELEAKTETDDDTESSASEALTGNVLTQKVKGLQKILEEQIKEEETNQTEDAADAHIHNKMAALAMLHQRVQIYLEMENDHEDSEDGHEKTLEAVGTLVDGLKNTHEFLGEKRKNRKPGVSTWVRILVYLCPILLSALCYLAFATAKK